ncbi:hypothetical protein FRX31_012432 [Thalictrum thalictroides]|uniref:Uncharacterized protein n=1 Tax=Thalictrum thalictroides TaxID=46969 RepID=A0A7J6WKS5_THATH|nr:hypothetical protein FRX31_012432 [Thalictrum thalictroides]
MSSKCKNQHLEALEDEFLPQGRTKDTNVEIKKRGLHSLMEKEEDKDFVQILPQRKTRFNGSKSFEKNKFLVEEKDPITNEEPSRIEFYRLMHYQAGKGWTDPIAEENYVRNTFVSIILYYMSIFAKPKISHLQLQEKMLQLRSQPPSDEGSSNVMLTDDEIADKVLGIRSGYVRGLGNCEVAPSRRLRVGSNHQEVEQLRRRAEDAESHLDELRTTQAAQQRQIEQQQLTLELVLAQMRNNGINFNLPTNE